MENGEIGFTRNGQITIQADGTLAIGGKPVLNEGSAPIIVPPDAPVKISADGTVWSGNVRMEQLGTFTLEGELERISASVVRAKNDLNRRTIACAWVKSNCRTSAHSKHRWT